MADEQVIASSARRPDSERSHTLKAHGKCKARVRPMFFAKGRCLVLPLKINPKAHDTQMKNHLTANPTRPPLMGRGGAKTKLQPLNLPLP